MNIRDEILAIFPNCDRRYLDKYIDIVTSPKMYANGEFTENHHILPKSIWRKYANIKKYEWNCATLSIHDHIYAHVYFSMCANSLWNAIQALSNFNANGTRKFPGNKEINAIIVAKKLYREHCRGKNAPFYGRKHTDESKQKISEARKGDKWNDERKQQLSKILKSLNMKRSDEFKAKCAERARTRIWTTEMRVKISAAHTGKKLSEKQKAEISKFMAGRKPKPMSEETLAKFAESRKAEGNPMYGIKHTDEWKSKHSEILKKANRKGPVWNELYDELVGYWNITKPKTGYMFSIWLSKNTQHNIPHSKLGKFVKAMNCR